MHGEFILDPLAAGTSINFLQSSNRFDTFSNRMNVKSVNAVLDNFWHGTSGAGDHRGSASQGFGKDDPEGFLPLYGNDHRRGVSQQRILLLVIYGADILNAVLPQVGSYLTFPIPSRASRFHAVARNQQTPTARLGDGNRRMATLDGLYPAKKNQRRVWCNLCHEIQFTWIDEIRNRLPVSARSLTKSGNVLRAAREG